MRDLGSKLFAAAAAALNSNGVPTFTCPKCKHVEPTIEKLAHARSSYCGFPHDDGTPYEYNFDDDFKHHLESVHGLVFTELETVPNSVVFCEACCSFVVGARHIREHLNSEIAGMIERMASDPLACSYGDGEVRLCPIHVVDTTQVPESTRVVLNRHQSSRRTLSTLLSTRRRCALRFPPVLAT